MVRSFFESSIINWPQSNDSNRPFGCLLSESICTIRNSKDLEEDEESSTIACSSWHVWSWFHLIELAGTGEHGSVDIRYAAAKSLLTSKALFWSTRSSVDGIRQDIQNSQYQDSKYSGGGAFSCRVWLLALKMLQVEVYHHTSAPSLYRMMILM